MCTLPHIHPTIDSSKLFYSYEHPKRIATSRLLKSQSEFSGSDYLVGIESRATLSKRSASKVDLLIQAPPWAEYWRAKGGKREDR